MNQSYLSMLIDRCGDARGCGVRYWWLEDDLRCRVRELHPEAAAVVVSGQRFKAKYNFINGAAEICPIRRTA